MSPARLASPTPAPPRDPRGFWSPEALARLVRGKWLAPPPAWTPTGVSVDTRSLNSGELFVALRGERFDGHDFLAQARECGAGACIVDDEAAARAALGADACALVVRDARAALGALARAWRAGPAADARLVAVTGSNGKTTTCRLLHTVLSQAGAAVASPRSFNNDVGVPLTLLAADPATRCIVSEIGSSAPGEVARLAAIAQPDIACVLCAELAHTQGLGDRAGVMREKASLAAALCPGGIAIAPADDDELLAAVRAQTPPGARVIAVGQSPDADVRIARAAHQERRNSEASASLGVAFALADGAEFFVPALGLHNARNAAFAVAIGRELGVRDSDIASALAGAEPAPMRLTLTRVGSVAILNDAYNANPASTVAALQTFRQVCAGARRRVVMLGDLLELGACESAGLEAVAREINRAGAAPIDALHAVGPVAARAAALVAGNANSRSIQVHAHPPLAADPALAQRLAEAVSPGDAVLLKGSRGAGLEAVEEAIRARLRDHEQSAAIPCSTS